MRGHFPGASTREEALAQLRVRRQRASTCKNCGHSISDHEPSGRPAPWSWWTATEEEPGGRCKRHDDGTDRPYVEQEGPPCPCPGFVPLEPLGEPAAKPEDQQERPSIYRRAMDGGRP